MVDLLERASEPLSSPNKRRQIGEEVPVSSNHSTANGMAATAPIGINETSALDDSGSVNESNETPRSFFRHSHCIGTPSTIFCSLTIMVRLSLQSALPLFPCAVSIEAQSARNPDGAPPGLMAG